MIFPRLAFAVLVLWPPAAGQSTTPDVGSGAPNAGVQQQFQLAFYRNGFAYTVSLPPLGDVKRLGTAGLVQEFQDTAKTAGVRLALVMPNANATPAEGRTTVFQMQAGLYAYFNTIGVNNAGMPTMDTANCPSLVTANACTYQLFDKPYALFVYKNPVNNGNSTFFVRDPYYTTWMSQGGIASMGPAISAEMAVTASSGTTATAQYFDQGAIYNVSSGANSGRILSVKAPIYSLFAANNVDQGFLGLPTSDELAIANGRRRQSFEGGSIEYDPADPSAFPTLRYPVASIVVATQSNVYRLKLGESVSLQASVYGPNGQALTDRQVLWSTSNGRVVSVQAGNPALVKATGGGTATVTATSEGKTSAPITFVVTAPCCQIGEGAPTSSIAQAFQDAVTRNRLLPKLPAAAAVVRAGSGYVQQMETVDGLAFLLAVPDKALTGFVVAGRLLTRYLELGGPTGSLGYPLGDATAGGRQTFENGTLAGDPVQVVTGDILAKWGLLGYERGAAGNPAAGAIDTQTFRATLVKAQAFQNALIVSVPSARTSKTYSVSGLILLKYAAIGGVQGRLGAPAGDEFGMNGLRRQDFEGGHIDYESGTAEARSTETPRQPVVFATPSTVLAGTRVTLALGGFNEGATVRVSITGQTDFLVTVGNGAHVWDRYVPADAASGSVAVRAVDTAAAANSAQTTYAIRAVSEARLQIVALRGDAQTGAPGALLPLPLAAVVKDESGNPVSGIAVRFTASPGAAVESSSTFTDANGEASARLRLPGSEGVALMTVEAGRQVLTMSARAAPAALAGFPKLTQAVDGILAEGPETIAQKGAMLAAVASMVRYLQLRGEAPAPAGLADVVGLNQHLRGACGLDSTGASVCDGFVRTGQNSGPFVNLWRVSTFAGGAIDVEVRRPDTAAIRDLIGTGAPGLVALELHNGAATSGHFVVATGVNADGSIAIADPNPAYGRATLDDYLAGFSTPGGIVRGSITGVAALLPRSARAGGFLAAANATVNIASSAGLCGDSFEIADAGERSQLRYCDGSSSLYQLDLKGPSFRGSLTDMGPQIARFDLTGGGATAFKAERTGAQWSVVPMDIAIAAHGIVNAASFGEAVAPLGLATVFGAGFGTAASEISVQVNGVDARVISVSPFQLNVQVPESATPGSAVVRVSSSAGTAEQSAVIASVAPALFSLAGGRAAASNRDGTINSATNPAQRGNVLTLFGTGFGFVFEDGPVLRTRVPVTATMAGVNVPVLFAGLAPGFPGLYQINLQLPVSMAPGLTLPVTVQQGNSTSNAVQVAVQ